MIHSKPSLLIVEDDSRFRTLVRAAAEHASVFPEIFEARDGQAALDLIREKMKASPDALPDCIISDLSMPRMDGLELLHQLKRMPETAGIPVAIMTSSNRPNDRDDATAAGCCAFFDKPLTMGGLVAIVSALPGMCVAMRGA